jgi:hypothetical protein
MTKRQKLTLHEKPLRVLGVINREATDPKEKARILDRLDGGELTYELGVETAEAGISFTEWPYRCLRAKEFRRGFLSTVTLVARDDLTASKDGTIINKTIN